MTLHIYTGNGGGKTTAALGVSLRAIGHGKKVIFVQFMKGRKDTGEWLVRDRLSPEFEIYQFGRPKFINLRNPSEEDMKLAKEGLKFAERCLERKPFILVLDEINVALRFNLITKSEILNFIKKIPKGVWVIFTGRYAPTWLYKYADFVTRFVNYKHPKKLHYQEGIEY